MKAPFSSLVEIQPENQRRIVWLYSVAYVFRLAARLEILALVEVRLNVLRAQGALIDADIVDRANEGLLRATDADRPRAEQRNAFHIGVRLGSGRLPVQVKPAGESVVRADQMEPFPGTFGGGYGFRRRVKRERRGLAIHVDRRIPVAGCDAEATGIRLIQLPEVEALLFRNLQGPRPVESRRQRVLFHA